jgi:hypothetical protein
MAEDPTLTELVASSGSQYAFCPMTTTTGRHMPLPFQDVFIISHNIKNARA